MRRWPSVALLLLVLATPTTTASPPDPEATPHPCLDVDVTTQDPRTGETTRRNGTYPPGPCGSRRASFTWDGVEGRGEVALRTDVVVPLFNPASCVPRFKDIEFMPFETADNCPLDLEALSADPPEPFDASFRGAVSRWLRALLGPAVGKDADAPAPGGPSEVRFDGARKEDEGPTEVNVTIHVHARFHVAWGLGDCAAPRGGFEAAVNDRTVARDAPGGFFESLCRLARSGMPEDQLATVAALVLGAVSRGAPSLAPHLDPIQAGFAALAARASDPSATGDATAILAPAQGSADVEGEVEADAGVQASAEAALAIGHPAPETPEPPPAVEHVNASAEPLAAPLPIRSGPKPPESRLVHPDALGAERGTPLDAPLPALVGGVRTQATTARSERDPEVLLLRAGAAAGALALLLVGFALYQRLRRPAALDHPVRAALYSACARLGRSAGARELGEAVRVGRTTAEYHLTYLSRLGVLRVDRDATGRRLFAVPATTRPAPHAPLAQRVLDLVREQPEVPLSTIMRALAVTRFRADRCVKDLLLEGKLASRWEDGSRLYFLPEG